MPSPGIRDLVKQISPPWLATGTAEKLLYAQGLAIDALLEKLNQAMRLHMPGYGDASALAFVGNDRLIGQGLTETAIGYATRLKYWLDDWAIAGSAHSVLQQTLGYLSALTPLVRTVSNSSVWDTYLAGTSAPSARGAANGPAHFVASPANWNWDGVSTAWWRWWLLLFATAGESPTTYTITGATNASPIVLTFSAPHQFVSGQCALVQGVGGNTAANGSWRVRTINGQPTKVSLDFSSGSAAYTSGGTAQQIFTAPAPPIGTAGLTVGDPSLSIGFVSPASLFTGITDLVANWKAANSWCVNVIVSFDSTLFDPAQSADGVHNPAGTFGRYSQISGGVYVPARFTSVRYCDGAA